MRLIFWFASTVFRHFFGTKTERVAALPINHCLSPERPFTAGLPDFSWCMIPKPEKIDEMNTKCTKGL
jgi:hypothetical protein